MMEFQNGPSRIKAKAIFRHNSRPALLNFYGKEKNIKIDDCRKLLKGLFEYGTKCRALREMFVCTLGSSLLIK
jgi:hypothetical protein